MSRRQLRRMITGRTGLALLLAVAFGTVTALTGCGSSGGHHDAVLSRDRLRALLITADALPVRGFSAGSLTASGDASTTVAGVEFTRPADELSTSVTLISTRSADAATALLPAQETGMGRDFVRVQRAPTAIGRNGVQITGTSGNTGKPATQIFFVEGTVQVTVIVSGQATAPLPAGFATTVARSQDAKIRSAT